MIFVKDINGTIHYGCPRCSSNWRYLKRPDYKVCENENCGMTACQHRGDFYFLTITISNSDSSYNIYWNDIDCMVDVENGDNEREADLITTRLPILPYDISIDKLKTYLVFS